MEKLYKITYEQIQQVHDNCVRSGTKILNYGRDFAFLK